MKHPEDLVTPSAAPEAALTALAELAEARSGLRFLDSRRAELAMKASRAFAASGEATWDAYLSRLSSPTGGDVLAALIEALTVGETYFFRHRAAFDALEQSVLPEIIARRAGARELRLWCAGCATGEEAYSLAIVVRRLLPDLEQWRVRILATDINTAFLARAEAGIYGEWSFRETDETLKAAYFTPEGKGYRIRPEIRRLVHFAPLNLAADDYPTGTSGTTRSDLIVCRNVLIYFAPERSREIVARLRASLAPEGWLMLGPSDALPGLMAGFQMHATPPGVLYRRREALGEAQLEEEGGAVLDSPALTLAPAQARKPEPVRLPAAPELPGLRETRPVAPVVLAETTSESAWYAAWQAARASADLGLLEAAEEHCRRAMAQDALRPEPYHLLGVLRQARGDDAGALGAFRQALYVDPTHAPALLALAALNRRAGNTAQARRALGRAQRLLDTRPAEELVLPEEGLTVGRLRYAVGLMQALDSDGGER